MVQVICYQFLMFHCNKQTSIPLCVCVSVCTEQYNLAFRYNYLFNVVQAKKGKKYNIQFISLLGSPLAKTMKKNATVSNQIHFNWFAHTIINLQTHVAHKCWQTFRCTSINWANGWMLLQLVAWKLLACFFFFFNFFFITFMSNTNPHYKQRQQNHRHIPPNLVFPVWSLWIKENAPNGGCDN